VAVLEEYWYVRKRDFSSSYILKLLAPVLLAHKPSLEILRELTRAEQGFNRRTLLLDLFR
jgi:hypothetical protein